MEIVRAALEPLWDVVVDLAGRGGTLSHRVVGSPLQVLRGLIGGLITQVILRSVRGIW